ncbi:thioredoxin-disulfide reductase [Microscilla marina]|uniref:Thioredoxin reductase n=1 Tax=Microscilla marina ATCC 23134 TaxID=313606 RepID=A1ZP07_MICM2|nr:thioredoxin-disulfide reductase [Microscilla marina]EAY27799.1 thioredoxin-disulfide reductase [Microscilla marina ATCC 23134]
MTTENVDCLIIGSGPAGYTAAIYASRAGLKPVLYTGPEPGGQLMLTSDVENFPGYSDGIMGPQMMEDFRKQATRFGADIRMGLATSVDFSGKLHKVIVDNKHEITAKSVIISTGASAKWLGLESELRLRDIGGGVSSCAVCDGFFFKDKDVVVVGGGDSAAEEASYLSKICHKVYLLVRRDEMRASKIMQQRVTSKENVEVLWNTVTEEVLGKEQVEAVRVKNNVTGETKDLSVSAFFVAIGHKPNTGIFKEYIDMDDTGYILTEKGTSRTNIEGVFASGDVQDKDYRQAITAAGSGCMAALDAERYLAEQEAIGTFA